MKNADINRNMEVKPAVKLLLHLTMILLSAICIFPLILLISISFSEEIDIINHGFQIIPYDFTTEAYSVILRNPSKIVNAYKISIVVTTLGTLLALLISSMLAYSLSRANFKYNRMISFYVFFTMLFGGGLVPSYILMTKYLQLQDNILVFILPATVSAYYVFILRGSFRSIPISLVESAKIDGASEFTVFWRIFMPLSTPVLATVGLFVALDRWNDWFTGLLYINDTDLYPLPMLLKSMMDNITMVTSTMVGNFGSDLLDDQVLPTESMRMAMCILATAPILILFPFLQKYFVQGLTLGSVKG